MFECPKEPLVPAEIGPAHDGITLPGHAAPVPRRFSLRPAQIGVPPAPASPKISPMGRPIPRWKGGMLQRQISELSLQRRARAFSLGDVTAVRNDRHTGPTSPTSPLALPNATSKSNPSSAVQNRPTQQTVASGISYHKKIDDVRQNSGSSDEKRREEAKTVSDPFGIDILAGKSAESTVSGLYKATPVSTLIKIDDHKARIDNQSLHSVVVDKPSSKHSQPFASSALDSLYDVKVDKQPVSSGFDGRKLSTMSQHDVELGSSASGNGRGSRSKSVVDKPRVSIESYKASTGLKIEKPATNPFEQYKANVEKKAPGSRKTSTEAKTGAVARETADTVQLESYRQISSEFKDPEA